MTARPLPLIAALALFGCEAPPEGPMSLVGDHAAPPTWALAGDTITVWRRIALPGGASRFQSYSITPGGTVEYLDEYERGDTMMDAETAGDTAEKRQGFTLPQAEFEAIRSQVALLRPRALGPSNPVGGYGGEAYASGCSHDPIQLRMAGVNFLNDANWGAFVLQPNCRSQSARAATAILAQAFDRLERAAQASKQP